MNAQPGLHRCFAVRVRASSFLIVTKRAVTLIPVHRTYTLPAPTTGSEQVYIAMVVDIAGTDTLAPSVCVQARLFPSHLRTSGPLFCVSKWVGGDPPSL